MCEKYIYIYRGHSKEWVKRKTTLGLQDSVDLYRKRDKVTVKEEVSKYEGNNIYRWLKKRTVVEVEAQSQHRFFFPKVWPHHCTPLSSGCRSLSIGLLIPPSYAWKQIPHLKHLMSFVSWHSLKEEVAAYSAPTHGWLTHLLSLSHGSVVHHQCSAGPVMLHLHKRLQLSYMAASHTLRGDYHIIGEWVLAEAALLWIGGREGVSEFTQGQQEFFLT